MAPAVEEHSTAGLGGGRSPEHVVVPGDSPGAACTLDNTGVSVAAERLRMRGSKRPGLSPLLQAERIPSDVDEQ